MLSAALLCLVVGVIDGDTLDARCKIDGQDKQIRVRINAIDAPDKGQDYFQASRKSLSNICYKKKAVITPDGTQSYNRIVAKVVCDSTEVAAFQVRTGMAWVATRYAAGRPDLPPLQEQAKLSKTGLWSLPNATEPWLHRRKN